MSTFSRPVLQAKIEEDKKKEKKQKRFRKKHHISEETVVIMQKAPPVITQLWKAVLEVLRVAVLLVLSLLAIVGGISLLHPELRAGLMEIFANLYSEFRTLLEAA